MVALRDRLALLLGCWTASVAAPPVGFALGEPFDGGFGALSGAVAGGLFVLGAVVARVGLARIDDPADRFRDGIEMAGAMAVAAVVLFGAVPVWYGSGLVAALPFVVGGTVGVLMAFLVGYVADRSVVARSRETSEFRFRWSAKKRPRSRSRWKRALDVVAVVLALGMSGYFLLEQLWVFAVFWLGVGLVNGHEYLPLPQRRRQYELTDDGLLTRVGYLPWEKFDAYAVTDDAVILHGNAWPFGTLAFDRESIDDPDAVIEALDRYLPEQVGDHNDPSPLDNVRQALGSG